MHLNSDYMVDQGVFMQRSWDGDLGQVSVFSDGSVKNYATDEIYAKEPYFLGSVDRVIADLQFVLNERKTVRLEKFILPDGGSGVKVTTSEIFEIPITNSADYDKDISGFEVRTILDQESGRLLSEERIVTFVDGTQRVFMQRTIIYEFVEKLPEEVINYLADY